MSYETETVAATLAHAATIRFPAEPRTASDGQKVRARTAVERAIALRKLKAEYEATGFLAMSLDEYLNRIARMAGVSVPAPVMKQRRPASLAILRRWVSLASSIEIAANHVRLMLRTWFAETLAMPQAGYATVRCRDEQVRESQRNGVVKETAEPEATAAALDVIEQSYSANDKEALAEALRLI